MKHIYFTLEMDTLLQGYWHLIKTERCKVQISLEIFLSLDLIFFEIPFLFEIVSLRLIIHQN